MPAASLWTGATSTAAPFSTPTRSSGRSAEASKALAASGHFDKPIVTDILPLGAFYAAEDYHQDYYKKNPIRYNWYRSGSGRDRFLEKTWAGARR